MKGSYLLGLAAVMFLSACGGDLPTQSTTPETSMPTKKASTLEAEQQEGKQVVILMAGDDMKFNAKEVVAKAGIPIELTFKHTGKAPKSTMGHNVVILKPETVVTDFINRANAAEATDYIPEDFKSNIIAHTKMMGGGEQEVITFTIDAPGTYVFLCSFPGHSGMMKGKFIIE